MDYDFAQVRLENDFVWEPILKSSQFNEDAVKEFCRHHPEYYTRSVELDGYRELTVEVRDRDKNIQTYNVYIDDTYNFYIKEVKRIVL